MEGILTEEHYFPSESGFVRIHTVCWYPDPSRFPQPKAVLQIAHGMVDHVERFDALARYMANRGFVVAGNDHLGHGGSVDSPADLGYFAPRNGRDAGSYVVADMHRLTRILKKRYPSLPYFLLGHSMGSFMARRYLMQYGEELTGAVILGTGNQPPLLVGFGKLLAGLTGLVKGDRYRSRLLYKALFGGYNRRIPSPATPSDWLTTDPAIVRDYVKDPKCSYYFTVNGYIGLFDTIRYVSSKKNMHRMPPSLPVLMASGCEDPVGGYGRDVKRLFKRFCGCLWSVELRLYEGCRHELHSEKNRDEIFEDLCGWMEDVLANP